MARATCCYIKKFQVANRIIFANYKVTNIVKKSRGIVTIVDLIIFLKLVILIRFDWKLKWVQQKYWNFTPKICKWLSQLFLLDMKSQSWWNWFNFWPFDLANGRIAINCLYIFKLRVAIASENVEIWNRHRIMISQLSYFELINDNSIKIKKQLKKMAPIFKRRWNGCCW